MNKYFLRVLPLLWLVGSIVFDGSCLASEPAASLTLTEAVETAIRKNPQIQAAHSRVRASEEKIVQARSGLYPQIAFQEVFNRTTNPMWAFGTKLNQESIAQPDFNPDMLNDPDPINNFASVFSVQWPLYNKGQTWSGLKQAKMGSQAQNLESDRIRQQVIAQTKLAYYGLTMALEYQKLIARTLDTARAHLKIVEARHEAGFAVKSDLLRAQVRIAELTQQLVEAESQSAIAMAGLNAAMNQPIQEPISPSTPLEIKAIIAESLDFWAETALSKRPELKAVELRINMAQEEIRKSKAAHLPGVSLVGNYEINSEDFSDTASNYSLGAVVQLDLYSGGRTTSKTREALAGLDEVEAMKTAIEQGVRLETQQAYLQVQSAQKRIDAAKAAVSQAEESLRIVENRYESGLAAMIVLLDAETALQQTRTLYLKAVHDYLSASARLHLAAGVIDPN